MKLTSDILKAVVLAELNLFQVSDKNLELCLENDDMNGELNDFNEDGISLDDIRRITREEIRNLVK